MALSKIKKLDMVEEAQALQANKEVLESASESLSESFPESLPTSLASKSNRSYKKLFLSLILLALILGGGGFYYNFRNANADEDAAKIAAKSEKENEKIIKKLGEIFLLPPNEKPVIYDIDDPNALSAEQAFFAGSEKGDKLLIYATAVKAIIYSPSRNKIINAGPITFDQETKPAN